MNRLSIMLSSVAAVALVVSLALPSLAKPEKNEHEHHDHAAHDMPAAAAQNQSPGFKGLTKAVAVLHPTEGNQAHGVLYFEQVGKQVHITGQIEGLPANSTHGFHIHQFGDTTASDGTSAGGHYNPEGHDHALPDGHARHAGDLGNVTSNDQGVADIDLTVDNITLASVHNPILGRGVIVHAQPDDGGQPTGNAGARIAAGVVGIAQNGIDK